jgi:pyruvate/2-oxoglutarate dehydrogenase complex dihydrolipoamide dehydrogenase (E3) component
MSDHFDLVTLGAGSTAFAAAIRANEPRAMCRW